MADNPTPTEHECDCMEALRLWRDAEALLGMNEVKAAAINMHRAKQERDRILKDDAS